MSIATILLIILILLLIGAAPTWPHQAMGYGWTPSGVLAVVLIIVLILYLMGRI